MDTVKIIKGIDMAIAELRVDLDDWGHGRTRQDEVADTIRRNLEKIRMDAMYLYGETMYSVSAPWEAEVVS